MKKKIVLIGIGKFGMNHLRNLMELDKKNKIKLVGVVDSDKNRLEKIEKQYGIKTSTKLARFIHESDAVDIVTPASYHYDMVKFCLRKGKHVFVEKPLALNSSDAKKLVDLSREKNLILQVGHIFRYNNAVDKLRSILSQKNNHPFYISGKFLQSTQPKSDIGAIFNFLHYFDILDYLLGSKPIEVFSHGNLYDAKSKHEINASIFLKYAKKVYVNLQLGWIPNGKFRNMELYSKKKSIFCDFEKQIIQIFENDRLKKKFIFKNTEPLFLELNDFVNSIGSRKKPKADGEVGARVVEISEKALKSLRENRVVKFS